MARPEERTAAGTDARSSPAARPEARRQVAWWSGRLKALLLPPTGLIWPGLLGLVLLRTRYADAGFMILVTVFALQVLLGLPAVHYRLLGLFDRHPPLDPSLPAAENSAIVVLDAGRRVEAREYAVGPERDTVFRRDTVFQRDTIFQRDTVFQQDTVKPMTLERLRYAAWLHRRLDRPILASGNGAGELMRRVAEESFDVPVRWCETASRNTLENARCSARLLHGEGIDTIYLVTHFWHMPRALAAFERSGLRVHPAPMGFQSAEGQERGWGAIIPRLSALEGSYWAIHEMIGLGWYRWRHGRKLDR